MLDIKKLFKALRILNSSDQSKAIEVSISDSSTTNTKTTIIAQQTADRTLLLPDTSATLIGTVNNNENISGISINLNNTTQNKLLVAGSSTGNSLIQDSSITHTDNGFQTILDSNSNSFYFRSTGKEVVIDGSSLRIPIVAFSGSTPHPGDHQGDLVFNDTTQSIWICDSTGFYIEQISASGANRTLSNLLSPTAINQDLIPIGNLNIGNNTFRFNAYLNNTNINSLVVNNNANVTGNVTANKVICNELDIIGTSTVLNSTTVDSIDPNITLNKSGNDTTSQGAGLTIDRTGTKGSLVYDSGLASRFKVGDLASESEIVSAGANQLISGNKIFNGIISLGQQTIATSGFNQIINVNSNTIVITAASISIAKFIYPIGISNNKGTIINNSGSSITLKHNYSEYTTDGDFIVPGSQDYIIAHLQSINFNSVNIDLALGHTVRQYYIEGMVDTSRIGMIESFAGGIPNIPTGYMYCDGSILARSTYPLLFSKIGDSWKKYNQTIAANAFVLPDLRGKFVRGATDRFDLSASVVFSPTLIATQTGASWSKAKHGDMVYVAYPGMNNFYFIDINTNPGSVTFYTTLFNLYNGISSVTLTSNGDMSILFVGKDRGLLSDNRFGIDIGSYYGTSTVGSDEIQGVQAHTHRIKVLNNAVAGSTAAVARPDGFYVSDPSTMAESFGSYETRPENSAVLYIIKYLPDYT